ncbi:MAG: hypothetical protein M4D80_18885 [Myxococcota bacterium]|nr:hypothetical protein [Deltaproteobacteria bacterium]MDQ3337234.1 hypothetical protein [Myxococcota bacterium]
MSARVLGKWLAVAVALVSMLGLCAELSHIDMLVQKLSLSYEGNVPTWVATLLLFSSALVAASIAQRALTFRRHWWGVAAVFAYASLDEAAELHEHMGGNFSAGGVLYFDWIIPAAVLLVALVMIFWPFVRALEPSTRRRLILAGAIYVGGAVLMELPLGWWTDRAGPDSLGYMLIDWVEETMELAGAALALHTLVKHREAA